MPMCLAMPPFEINELDAQSYAAKPLIIRTLATPLKDF